MRDQTNLIRYNHPNVEAPLSNRYPDLNQAFSLLRSINSKIEGRHQSIRFQEQHTKIKATSPISTSQVLKTWAKTTENSLTSQTYRLYLERLSYKVKGLATRSVRVCNWLIKICRRTEVVLKSWHRWISGIKSYSSKNKRCCWERTRYSLRQTRRTRNIWSLTSFWKLRTNGSIRFSKVRVHEKIILG